MRPFLSTHMHPGWRTCRLPNGSTTCLKAILKMVKNKRSMRRERTPRGIHALVLAVSFVCVGLNHTIEIISAVSHATRLSSSNHLTLNIFLNSIFNWYIGLTRSNNDDYEDIAGLSQRCAELRHENERLSAGVWQWGWEGVCWRTSEFG